MILPLSISLTLLWIITFFVVNKRTHVFVFIFTLLAIEYSFTSYISVIVDNANLWELKKSAKDYIMFRMAEVVVIPILLLFYIKVVRSTKRIRKKLFFSATWIVLLLGIELLLVYSKVITYKHWAIWKSVLAWIFFISLTFILQFIFNKILIKEGIVK